MHLRITAVSFSIGFYRKHKTLEIPEVLVDKMAMDDVIIMKYGQNVKNKMLFLKLA